MRNTVLPLTLLVLLLGCPSGATGEEAEPVTFDHGAFDKLLGETVKDGRVDYAAIKKHKARLDAYLATLADAKPERLSKDGALAFWINAYNAFTLKLIINHYPGVKSITDIPDAWKKKDWRVAKLERSLDEIEHQIIRKQFAEPRIHFALVCASISCPGLSRKAYTAENLKAQLDRETRRFLKDTSKGAKVVLREGRPPVLELSLVFKWFKDDFRKSAGSVLEFVLLYLPAEAGESLRAQKNEVRIQFLDYDWRLNKR